MKGKVLNLIILILVSVFILPSCGTKRTVPITGRKIRIAEGAYSDGQMLETSKAYYPLIIKEYGKLSSDKNNSAVVAKVANNLINATNKYMKENGYGDELKYYEWEVKLVESKVPNAFCMPGGKIVVLEGILPAAKNEAGLAAILGHEIGHAIGHHSAEAQTKAAKKKVWQSVGAVGLTVAGAVTNADMNEVQGVTEQIVGLSDEVMQYVEQHYSRKQEYEADHMGLVLMALAGYDPREAPKLWTRMTEMYGETPGTLLDSHPSNKKRKQEMEEKWMGQALAYYNSSSKNASSKSNVSQTSGKSLTQSQSAKTGQYTVTANRLNVRVSPSTGADVLGALQKGQTVTVKSVSNGWATITFKGRTAYINASYITPTK